MNFDLIRRNIILNLIKQKKETELLQQIQIEPLSLSL